MDLSSSNPAISSDEYCTQAQYSRQRAKFLSSYEAQIMTHEPVRHVKDSYTFRVAPNIDLAFDSYLPCNYTPNFQASAVNPRPPQATIVFLHDFGSTSQTFKRVIEDFRCHCITVDFRGCGESSRAPTSRLYSVENMAQDMLKLLPKLEQVTEYILAGHGMGAKIAQIIASGRPAGLIGLALINPVPASPWLLSRQNMQRLYGSCQTKTEALDFANGVLSAHPGSLTVDDLDIISANAIKQDPALTIAWLREGSEGKEGDWSGLLDLIETPTMAVAARSDRLIDVRTVRDEVYGKIYGCIKVEIKDAGHLLPLEKPQRLMEELQAFNAACVDVRKCNGLRSGSHTYQGYCMKRETDWRNFMRSQGLGSR